MQLDGISQVWWLTHIVPFQRSKTHMLLVALFKKDKPIGTVPSMAIEKIDLSISFLLKL